VAAENRMVDMQQSFNEILSIDGVKGFMMVSFAGDLISKQLNFFPDAKIEAKDWRPFIESLADIRETDLVYEKGRLYIRRTKIGYLIVLMGFFAPIAMIRLQCDISLPALNATRASKGVKRLFRKK
jgi:hypothetical protein